MLALFAQAAGNGNDDFDDLTPQQLMFVCGIYLVVGLIEMCMSVGLAFAASRALSQCRPRKRTMEPGQAWLNLIPIFHLVWQFFTVNRVAESLRREVRSRGLTIRDDFGKGLGIPMCIMRLITCTWPISVICFLVYCVRISGYTKRLIANDEDDEDKDDRQDDEDDRRHDEDDGDRPSEGGRRRR
jgi:hypothetical protein